HLAITVQHQGKPVPGAALAEILGHTSGTPQGSDIGVGDEQNFLRQVADQTSGAVESGGSVHDDVVKQADHGVKEAGKVGSGGLDSRGNHGAGQQLQAVIVTDHEAVEQGRVQAMQIREGVRDGECRLEIKMQGAVTEWCQVYQCRAVVKRLQGQSQIDGDGGGAAAAFAVHDREHLSPRTFASRLATSCRQADESFQQIGGGGGALNVFAHTRPHGTDNQLGLSHGTDDEDGGIGKFLVQQLHGP